MKHGVYEISFFGHKRFEVYVWIGKRQLGHIGTFKTKNEALTYFEEQK